MEKKDLLKDSEEFRNKEGFGYVHGELSNKVECKLYIAGDGNAIEALAYELIHRLSEEREIPVPVLLTRMLLIHTMDKDDTPDEDDDTLEIE